MIVESNTTVEHPGQAASAAEGRPPCAALEVCGRPTRTPRRPGGPPWQVSTAKRLLDVGLALVMLAFAAPVVLLAGLLVKLTSRGPVFYSQTRVGRGGKPFTIYKIRTMYHNCERLTGARWSRPGDPRVMPIGRLLRRTHLDELPQLWNILRGDMSLVGPRPERPEFVPQLEQAIPRYAERLLVLPGVTGLAQVHHGPDTDLHSVRRKLAYDLYYMHRIGFWFDLRILAATCFHVVVPFCASRLLFGLTDEHCLTELDVPPAEEAR